ncbi:fungal-specific transcription factor domain-containing protein [Mycena sanguinolenta]|nr:fungal-specific transcription factor domain-containing protein [Mycena sanguinolenta]
MTSSDEDYELEQDSRRKRRRVIRACDFCRHRKTKCDGSPTVAGNKCTTCLIAKIDCTYVKTPVSQPPKVYLDSLEAQLERSEGQVRQLRAELADIYFANTTTLNKPSKESFNSSAEAEKTTTERHDGLNASLCLLRRTLGVTGSPPPPHADDLVHSKVAESFTKMSVTPRRIHPFVGKSSGAVLVKAVLDLKADIKREEREEALGSLDNQSRVENGEPEGEAVAWTSRRLQYWTWRPLKDLSRRTSPFKFPPKPLMTELIDLYFTRQNVYMPVLHRPTFERSIMENLHLRDDGFASTVLLVCGIGSRWRLDVGMVEKDLAAGWEWFDQVSQVGYPLFRQADLYDLQYYCLAAQFLAGFSGPQAAWSLVGIGLRLAQDIGVHRRKAHVEVPSVERELFKRAFWVLMCQDRMMSAVKGRTCALHHEDFDIDQPLEVDDEYWEHPTHPFQQPAGKPSQLAYFNALIHLTHILSISLKTLYSLNKMPMLFSSCEDWDESAVPELDSALNSWHEKIPGHLRWNPVREDPIFFDQSVALHGWYYNIQILIHRPLIPMVGKSTPMGLPSLASCTNAARACANLLHCQRQQTGNVPIIVNLSAAFTSALVLLLNVWSGKRTGLLPDPGREMANVYKCMEVIRLCQGRWVLDLYVILRSYLGCSAGKLRA